MFFNGLKRDDIVVVVPMYKNILNEEELLALRSIKKFLSAYDVAFICPHGLENAQIEAGSRVDFDSRWFKSANDYSELLLSAFFYEKFASYKYMLVVQLDALIFRDDLLFWAGKHYDYIGAPWMFNLSDYMPYINDLVPKYGALLKKKNRLVGNGGLSLRKIKSFLFVLDKFKAETDDYKRKARSLNWGSEETPPMNEDVFWGLYVPSIFSKFKVPDYRTAMNFSIETQPEQCVKMLGGKLPFGCHAWNKHGREFWLGLLRERSYMESLQ